MSEHDGNGLARSDFSDGHTFFGFGFDLNLDPCDGSWCHMMLNGNQRIEIHFAAALAETVNVIVQGGARNRQEQESHLRLLMDTERIT